MLGERRRGIRGLTSLLALGAAVVVLALIGQGRPAGEARSLSADETAAADAHAAVTVAGAEARLVSPAVRRRYVFPLSPARVAAFSPGGHPYPATDIFAPIGTRYVAATSGVIESVNRIDRWDPAIDDGANRGGRWVSLIGDDGLRYYGSHFSVIVTNLKPGDRVGAGQVLAYVGVSGSARGTPPHVHFGISCPSTPTDWERRRGEFDPVPYLTAWRAGVFSSPADAQACGARGR